ncbi:hypothetical protein SAMN05444266_10623 [Chitinophaga jiangningensis]|uniref:Uncharacterized protein n=1 Tax=Chitinophaga jiangningensis TaxID=1419482 RepID=A0A1M7F774_9BACT|nr:hypothetical protein [Chitinophaga jiangningensis]SHL99942.1 hypothetical protein SAMN05444266_10623 [Chitinophaga jiangningensis]
MNNETTIWTPISIFLIAIALVVYWIIRESKRKKEWRKKKEVYDAYLAKLEEAYKNSLKGTDKSLALDLGRKYYKMIRNGELTIYDEQAIANDLSTMK